MNHVVNHHRLTNGELKVVPAIGDDHWRIVAHDLYSYHDHFLALSEVDQLADEVMAVARVKGTSLNNLIVDSLRPEIEKVRSDKEFTTLAHKLIKRDKELLERLAR